MTEAGPEAWVRCRQWIEDARAAADPLNTLEEIAARIASGQAQLWAGERSAAVTQIVDYPKGRALGLWLAGGDLRELRSMLPDIEAWARRQGCIAQYLTGRPAWGAVLKRHGFRPGHVTYEKEL